MIVAIALTIQPPLYTGDPKDFEALDGLVEVIEVSLRSALG